MSGNGEDQVEESRETLFLLWKVFRKVGTSVSIAIPIHGLQRFGGQIGLVGKQIKGAVKALVRLGYLRESGKASGKAWCITKGGLERASSIPERYFDDLVAPSEDAFTLHEEASAPKARKRWRKKLLDELGEYYRDVVDG